MKDPLVSIIILNYNGLNDLKECIDSLYNLSYKNFELILVDNNSQDKSVELIRKNYREVKIIQLDKNYGYSKGNNIGVRQARGKYIVLLNMDTVVDKNWLSELVKVAEQSKNIGIVGSKNYYYDDRTKISFGIGLCNKLGNPKIIGLNKKDNILVNTQTECFFVCGASLLLKRELYEKIELFDPAYFAYYEDVDLCWRAWISSYKVIYAPKSYLYHKIGVSFKDILKKKYWVRKNRLRSILKNYEVKTIVKIMPLVFFEWLMIIFSYLIRRNKLALTYIIIYLKVVFWNIFHIKSLIRNRVLVQAYRKKNDKFLFRLMENLNHIKEKKN